MTEQVTSKTLVERLRLPTITPSILTCREAADEIERLTRERDALRAENERLRGTVSEAAAAMRGERGATDQGEAWDQASDILNAALEGT